MMYNFSNNLTPCCFETLLNAASYIKCPKCGHDFSTAPQFTDALPIGTVLNAKYVIGKVLGKGGFGITYLAYDLTLDRTVAIKEYFPAGVLSRDKNGFCSLSINDSATQVEYIRGREQFVKEGRMLARLEGCQNIVSIYDNFQANNTAYIVMNYVQGKTLKKILSECPNGKMPFSEVFSLLRPAMLALDNVHAKGLFHMDISPDNIIITLSGQPVVIDFGAAKLATRILHHETIPSGYKSGYSPFETHESNGKIGQWTDVYSMAATIYRAVTGKMPPDAVDRVGKDSYISPEEAGADITDEADFAITKALSMDIKSRPQSMQKFVDLLSVKRTMRSNLHSEKAAVNQSQSVSGTNLTRSKTTFKIKHYLFAAAILLLVVGVGLCTLGTKDAHKQQTIQTKSSENAVESYELQLLDDTWKQYHIYCMHRNTYEGTAATNEARKKALESLEILQERSENDRSRALDCPYINKLSLLQYRMGSELHNEGNKEYKDNAVKLLEQSLDNGFKLAGYKLYIWYCNGFGVEQDSQKAKEFFKSSFDGLQSIADDISMEDDLRAYAMSGLATEYHYGVLDGKHIDYRKALKLYENAEKMGERISQKKIEEVKLKIASLEQKEKK